MTPPRHGGHGAPVRAADAVRDFRPHFDYPYPHRGQEQRAFGDAAGNAAGG